MKHNNVIANQHFKKDWQNRVRTWFNQPGRKVRRRKARLERAIRVAPRPTGQLRPAIRCSSARYNRKLKEGRGFTLAELKAAGVSARQAGTIGIAVDHRRRNKSAESLQRNVARLQEYQSRLIVFPRRANKQKPGDSSAEDCNRAVQNNSAFPVSQEWAKPKSRVITPEERSVSVYRELRIARSNARTLGKRTKRAAEKEEEAKNKKNRGRK